MRKWMKAREPSSLLRLRSSFVVIPSGGGYIARPAFPIFEEKRRGTGMGMEAGGGREEDSCRSTFPLLCPSPRNGPKRYYNYFTRTGIIKTETDASPGEKQARLECITLTVKTLSHARLVSLIFGGNFASLLSYPPDQVSPWERRKRILIEMENEKREVEIEHRIFYEYPRGDSCNF